jgi:hypothetical protein
VRWWLPLVLLVAIPALAVAKPKVAVAPLDGDPDGKVSEAVAEAAAEHAKVTGPERVERAMKNAAADKLDSKTVKRLRVKLEVDVVIYGRVERDGSRKRLELTLSGKSKQKPRIELDFKSAKALRKELAAKLGRRIDEASEGEEDDDDSGPFKKRDDDERAKRDEDDRRKKDDEDRRKKDEDERRRKDDEARRRKDDDDRRRKRDEEERASKRDDDRRRKRRDEDDDDRRRRIADDEDEDEDDLPRTRKRKRRGDDRPRHAVTQAALWLDAGGAFARRTLTYVGTGAMQPPRVGTVAPAGRVEAELYPAAFSTLKGAAASLGIAGTFSRTFGLGIDVPGTTVTAPIKNGHYSVGARYRFTFGSSSLALGASYWRRHYIADRSGLMMPEQLDMPDVDYTAIAPAVVTRVALRPTLAAFASVEVPLMLDSGPIQANTSYGPSTIIAFDIRAGAQIALGSHYALQIAAELDQVGIQFTGRMGTQSALRGVTSATDRSIGLAATLGVMY